MTRLTLLLLTLASPAFAEPHRVPLLAGSLRSQAALTLDTSGRMTLYPPKAPECKEAVWLARTVAGLAISTDLPLWRAVDRVKAVHVFAWEAVVACR